MPYSGRFPGIRRQALPSIVDSHRGIHQDASYKSLGRPIGVIE
jgi:hypothetical protein